MAGNVAEWCADWQGAYAAAPVTDPRGPEQGSLRIIRGGNCTQPPAECQPGRRDGAAPGTRSPLIGLRIAAAPP